MTTGGAIMPKSVAMSFILFAVPLLCCAQSTETIKQDLIDVQNEIKTIRSSLGEGELKYLECLMNKKKVGELNSHGEGIKKGDIGYHPAYLVIRSGDYVTANKTVWKISQITGPSSFLLEGNAMWVDGVDVSEKTDGGTIDLGTTILYCDGTKKYQAVSGAMRSIVHLVAVDAPKVQSSADRLNELESLREWSLAGGKSLGVARMTDFKNGKVNLVTRTGAKLDPVPPIELSKADQEWMRQDAKRRAEEKRKAELEAAEQKKKEALKRKRK